MSWGYHLIIDCGQCSDLINDHCIVKAFITALVRKLDMHPIGAPIVVYVDMPEGRGVTAVQIITTSTIIFHGDSAGNKAFIDVFSCKTFDPEMVLEFTKDLFSPKVIKHEFRERDAS